MKALGNAVQLYRRSRPSPRFIVGDQYNTTRTTRELGFRGSRKHGSPTGLRPRSARFATPWRLSHLEQGGWPTIPSITLGAFSPSHGGGPQPSWAWQAAWPDAGAVSSQCIGGDDDKTPDAPFLGKPPRAMTKPGSE